MSPLHHVVSADRSVFPPSSDEHRAAGRSVDRSSHAALTALPTVLNLLLAACPRNATAAMITTAISATIRAYSTAVAPFSSLARIVRSLHQVLTPMYMRANICHLFPLPFHETGTASRLQVSRSAGPSIPLEPLPRGSSDRR